MGRVYIEDLICEGEKKLAKVVDENNTDNFLLVNGYRIKHFDCGYDRNGRLFKYELYNLFNGGFIISKIIETKTTLRNEDNVVSKAVSVEIVEIAAYNYMFDKIASTEDCSGILPQLTSNEAFSKFVKDNSLNKENEEISK